MGLSADLSQHTGNRATARFSAYTQRMPVVRTRGRTDPRRLLGKRPLADASVDREVDSAEAPGDDAYDEGLEPSADVRGRGARDAIARRSERDPVSAGEIGRRSGNNPAIPPKEQRLMAGWRSTRLLGDAHWARWAAHDGSPQPAPITDGLPARGRYQRRDRENRDQPHSSSLARWRGPANGRPSPARSSFSECYGLSFAMCVDQLPSADRGPAAPGDGAQVPSLLSPVVAPKNRPPHVS